MPGFVTLIPTKEAVYCGLLQRSGTTLPLVFARLCSVEVQTDRELSSGLASLDIRYLDPLRPLQAAAAKHEPLYPSDDDGHPIAAGYGVVAKAVYEKLAGD